jgi:hypothetical protein
MYLRTGDERLRYRGQSDPADLFVICIRVKRVLWHPTSGKRENGLDLRCFLGYIGYARCLSEFCRRKRQIYNY